MLDELRISLTITSVPFCDNIKAGMLAKHPILHYKIKHVEVDFHFARERVPSDELVVDYTPSKEKLTGIMIKSLNIMHFKELRT